MYPIAPPAKSGSREAAVAFIMMGYLTSRGDLNRLPVNYGIRE
jgi:hypothetical protein